VLNCVGRLVQLTTPKNVIPDTPDILIAPPTGATVSHAIVIGVTDCHAAYEVLRKRGAEFLTAPVHTVVGTRCWFRDSDGHLLELRETWFD
jgi:predicted enzyme related to lactoylglutathione lyase